MRRLGRFFSGELTAGRLVFWGGLVTLLYAVLSTGVYHPDEHFQILEYAHMKLFGKPAPEQLPWEYGLKMRPGFQPMIAYAVGKLLLFAGVYSPHLLALLLRLFSGALSMWAVWSFGRAAVRRGWLGPSGRNWFLGLSFGLWMLVYLHVRFSSEILAGNLLMLFVSFYLLSDRDRGVFRRGLALGLLAGGAFVARYQIGFALLGFGLWMLAFDRRWRMIAGMLLSFALMIGVGVLCDRWLYGEWTCTPLNYLTENMLHGHIDTFGIDPWYYYLYAIPFEGGIVFGGVVLAAAVWFFVRYPRHVLTWTLLLFLAAHQAIGHKEVRFLFPALLFAPFFIVRLAESLPPDFLRRRAVRVAGIVLAVVNGMIMIAALAVPGTNICFFDRVERLAESGRPLALVHLRNQNTYYCYNEAILDSVPRLVMSYYWMPADAAYRTFDSAEELGRGVRELSSSMDVYLLSEDPEPEVPGCTLQRVAWSPFPKWVTTHFNFNDWAGRSIRTRNIFRISPDSRAVARQE